MCGIAGIVGFSNFLDAQERVQQMTATIARRGPDGEGFECWKNAILGHRRLAIIDLSDGGRQPMLSADGRVGVVFNGEIYNYRHIRRTLQANGCVFRTDSDTEVLIHGYRSWGIDKLVQNLRGMFALAIWDELKQRLYLVRDRLGVKPLIFVARGHTIAFASTIRALRASGFVSQIDEHAVADFLENGYIHDHLAIYRGATKLPAASILEWHNGTFTQREYWTLPSASTSRSYSFKKAVDETEELLLDAVQIRLHSDVPVGTLLSGGIDSGLVSWAVTKLGGNLTAYTIGVPGDPWDETAMARDTARRIGITHQVVEMSSLDEPKLEELVSAYAEPFACSSALGMLRISKAIGSSVKVLLTGDGGDDVFLGYPRQRHLWIAGKLAANLPPAIARNWLAHRSLLPRVGPLRRLAALMDYSCGDLKGFTTDQNARDLYRTKGLLGQRLTNLAMENPAMDLSTGGSHRFLAGLVDFERRRRFVGEYLTKVDGATMHFGVEARSPLLDQHLWEFASGLPFDLRLHGGVLKAILRRIAQRRIGRSIAIRKKRGFGIPAEKWLIDRWRPLVETAFHESSLDKEGWINSKNVLAELNLAVQQGMAPSQLWYLFVLELWMKYEQEPVPTPARMRPPLEVACRDAG